MAAPTGTCHKKGATLLPPLIASQRIADHSKFFLSVSAHVRGMPGAKLEVPADAE